MGFLQRLFSSDHFMPHGSCYMWDPYVIWLHVLSDGLIALAYFSIPITLLYFVSRRKDLVFDWMFLCFAAFIVSCGTTHIMEIVNIWYPNYWLSGLIKVITAVLSVTTAILLIRLIPAALRLPSPAQLRQANAELQKEVGERTAAVSRGESLNRALLLQTAQLESANQELETFSYSVSHDLRAPLRHIDGYVELLEDESAEEPRQRYMKMISDSARQMTLLIDNLLSFSRMGRAALRPAWVDTAQMVAEAREELSPETKNRKINWTIDPLPEVHVDPALFKQVWLNLLGNAIKYTSHRNEAEISITSHANAKDIEFSVHDNGAGFDMHYVDKLFGVFQRLHSKEAFEGTGIGLANVRRIVSRHGGRTWAEGQVDQGATFFFTIPKSSPE